jgi:hypothetical protein
MKQQHSTYWLDDQYFDEPEDLKEDESAKTIRLMRLAAVRRAVANFVTILTGKDLPVHFSSGLDSYTDGKKVVISADDRVEHFDSMVGLALHEASHVLLTDFETFVHLHDRMMAWYGVFDDNHWHALVHPDIVERVGDIDRATRVELWDNLKMLMNMLEDRRIDKYVYRTAPGYRPYYDALYERYFFKGDVLKNLQSNPDWRKPTLENYLNHLLFHFVPNMDHDALPGLKQLVKMVDIDNIERIAPRKDDLTYLINVRQPTEPTDNGRDEVEYSKLPTLWLEANALLATILRYVEMAERAQMDTSSSADAPCGGSLGDAEGNEDGEEAEGGDELPNLDHAPTLQDFKDHNPEPEKPKKVNAERGKKQLQEMKDAMEGKVKRRKLGKADSQKMEAMEESGAELHNVKWHEYTSPTEVLVIRRITDATLKEPWFPFAHQRYGYQNSPAIAAGRRMGAVLVQKLQIRNDEKTTEWTRQPSGRVDRRLLAGLGANDMNVFYRTRTDTYRPALLHLTLDASGSMQGDKWNRTVAVATALAYVGKNMRNVEVVISLRGGMDMPIVAVAFDSRRDSFHTFTRLMNQLGPGGSTPEGLTFKAIERLITEETKKFDTYFINFSDGDPAFSARGLYYSGVKAAEHTRGVVENIRRAGVNVLSYFIGHEAWHPTAANLFRIMYGTDSQFVDVQNVHQVLRTLNERLV